MQGVTLAGSSGLPDDYVLNAFAEAVCRRDAERMTSARADVETALGERGMLDAAAVIAGFNAYPRIADATGIPLDPVREATSVALREALGLDAFRRDQVL